MENDELRSQRHLTIRTPVGIRKQLERDGVPVPESFTFRRRTVRDSTRIAIKQDEFCFGEKPKMNNESINLQFAAAVLAVTMEVPSGFDFQELESDSDVIAMFLEYEAWRNGFPPPGSQGATPPG